ncbi:MAG: M56 family metallopeptidase [Acidobacteria bacterium]|nr:M56 family metallopeptidase [Acidobacteriota bacterium]
MIHVETAQLLAYLGNAAAMAFVLAAALGISDRWLVRVSSGWRAALGTATLLAIGILPAVALWPSRPVPVAAFVVDTQAVAAAAPFASTPFHWSNILLALAALAAGGRLMWVALGVVRLDALRRSSLPTTDPTVRQSSQVATPVTFGFLDPVILVPQDQWAQMPAPVREAVLAHERAHIARRDYFWNLCVEVMTLGLWWHPGVVWLKQKLTLARECSCDDLAAAWLPDYADRLLEAAAQLLPAPVPQGALGVLDGDSFSKTDALEVRMLNLTRSPWGGPLARRAMIAGAAFLMAAVAVTVTVFPVVAAPPDRKTYTMKDEGVKAPKLTQKVEPKYSEQARDAKIEGVVKLHVVVNEEGVAEDIYVLEGLEETLDQNAIEAITQWRFTPGTKDGTPVAVEATIEVNFRLL